MSFKFTHLGNKFEVGGHSAEERELLDEVAPTPHRKESIVKRLHLRCALGAAVKTLALTAGILLVVIISCFIAAWAGEVVVQAIRHPGLARSFVLGALAAIVGGLGYALWVIGSIYYLECLEAHHPKHEKEQLP